MTPPPMDTQSVVKPNSGKGLRIALALSVAVNLAVLGLVAGVMLRDGPGMRGAMVRDLSDDWLGFSVQGPNARAVIETLTGPLSLPMMGCAEVDVGLTRARIARLSLSGELAYEINVPAACHATLRRQLLTIGAAYGLREIGFAAMLSDDVARRPLLVGVAGWC